MTPSQNVIYSWDFEDSKTRSPIWYMVALALVIGLVFWWFTTRQYGMSLVIMLGVWFFYFLEVNSEDQVKVAITELWISVQDIFYDYSRISWYSLVYNGDMALYLRLHLKKRGIWYANIRIDNTTAAKIRSILPNYIEENAQQEVSFLEKISHLLKL